MKLKILGIIVARGGSKGIPGKNIKELNNKPLIAYTINSARESGIFDKIILSTDDKEIADVGNQYGVEVPFIRPDELARDNTPTLPVLQHAVKWLKENENLDFDYVSILQPTAPLRQPHHLKEAWGMLQDKKADSVVGVVEIPGHYSPYWAEVKNEEGLGELFMGGPIKKRILRRQDFPKKAYAHNGAIYIFKTKLLFNEEDPNFYGDEVVLYEMDPKYSVNLDEPEDWLLAEQAIKEL